MKRWQKWTVAAVVVLAAVGGSRAAGWWGTSPTDDKTTLNFSLSSEIQTLDISKATDAYSGTILGNSESNFLRMNAKGEPAPDLAKSYDVSADGLTYTMHLRSGLKWSDGSALTAKDFVYSWQRIANPKTASQYAYLTSGVKNADDIVAGKKDVSELGVSAPDKNTVVFTLEKPMPQFKYLLSFATFAPQKESVVKDKGSKYGTTADNQVYSGAYKVEGWNGTNNQFKLVKNTNYWNTSKVKTKKINFQVIKKPETAVKLYKQGKLDRASISATPELYAANKNNKDVVKVSAAQTSYLEYNQAKNPYLANAKIRQALNLATNRKELTQQISGGITDPATGLVSKNLTKAANGQDLSAYVNPGYTYDTAKAKELFKEGMKEVGKGQVKLTLLTDADVTSSKNLVDYLKQSWESTFGSDISVSEKIEPFKQRLQDSQSGNFDIVVTTWAADYQDGSTFYDLFKSTDTGYNNGQFKNQAYIDAVNKAEGDDANNPSARDADWKAAEAALKDQANINPLTFGAGYSLSRPSVKGIVTNQAGLTIDYTYAYRK